MRMEELVQKARDITRHLLQTNQVEASHGFEHALAVVAHAEKMVACERVPLDPRDALAVRLAALLHDVDDRKLFPQNRGCENARQVLESVQSDQELHEKVLEMIQLVSTSTNGNAIDASASHWMLFPRFADRLEAIGPIGVERCLAYTRYLNRPLFDATTPRASTLEELWQIATKDRFESYLQIKTSATFIDHFYDKLLHIGTQEALGHPKNPYLIQEATSRHNYVVDYVLHFGRTGQLL